MKKYSIISSLIFLLFLNSCKQEIKDITINFILDHPINPKLSQNDSLYSFIRPSEYDDVVLNIIPIFQKIDVDVPILDTIKSDEGIIYDLQKWISGGKKNAKFFVKKRTQQLEKAIINSTFSLTGDTKYVDSFYAKKNNLFAVYSATNFQNISNDLKGGNIKVFNSIKLLKNYILDSLKNNSDTINILFEPTNSIIPIHTVVKLKDTSERTPIVKSPLPIPGPPAVTVKVNSSPPVPIQEDQISVLECDSRIRICMKKPQNKDKVEYFFLQIFRFVKNVNCNDIIYKNLIIDIFAILKKEPPTAFDKSKNNVYFNLICSNETDFKKELEKYNISVNATEYSNIFTICPHL